MIYLKSEDELKKMRIAGRIVAEILDKIEEQVRPGVSTAELDALAESLCHEKKVIPAFKGYRGFPGVVCFAINDEVVHGIASSQRILKSGDIVGIDFGVSYEGWFGDSARTVAVGEISTEARKLLNATKESLYQGIQECQKGKYISDIGNAVQKYVEKRGYNVVREFVGHGIGKALHEDPPVPNYVRQGKGVLLQVGMVLAIEPMINIGKSHVRILEDGWTVVTVDGSLSAHYEHTVAITANGPEILTVTK